jgi:hypothetical protein
VDVPVDQRTLPDVPEDPVLSNNAPKRVSAEVDALARTVLPVTSRFPEMEKLVVEALESVVCPVTVRVPLEVRELVKIPSVARRRDVKKDPVEVALVNDDETAVRTDEKKDEEVAFVIIDDEA